MESEDLMDLILCATTSAQDLILCATAIREGVSIQLFCNKKVKDKAEAKAAYDFWWGTFFINADNNAEPVVIDLGALDIAL